MFAQDLLTEGFTGSSLQELCSALPTGERAQKGTMGKGLRLQCPKGWDHSLCCREFQNLCNPCKPRRESSCCDHYFTLFKPGITSSQVSQSSDICCLRFFFIMSSLKKTRSLCSSNKGRFHHNEPRICNIKQGKLQATGSNRREIKSHVHSPPWTGGTAGSPPHWLPANLGIPECSRACPHQGDPLKILKH